MGVGGGVGRGVGAGVALGVGDGVAAGAGCEADAALTELVGSILRIFSL